MGDLKLIIGHPGTPDGHIRPDQMSNDEKYQVIHDDKHPEYVDLENISSKRIYLFNITGILYY